MSEQPAPIPEATPSPDHLEVPELPAAEPSDEEAQIPVVPTTRNKRGGGTRKNARKLVTPTPLDENDGQFYSTDFFFLNIFIEFCLHRTAYTRIPRKTAEPVLQAGRP
jgi:hypothetical protein